LPKPKFEAGYTFEIGTERYELIQPTWYPDLGWRWRVSIYDRETGETREETFTEGEIEEMLKWIKPPEKRIEVKADSVKITYSEKRWTFEIKFKIDEEEHTVTKHPARFSDAITLYNLKLETLFRRYGYDVIDITWDHFPTWLEPEKTLSKLFTEFKEKYKLKVDKLELIYAETFNSMRITYKFDKYEFDVFSTIEKDHSILNVEVVYPDGTKAFLLTKEERRAFTVDEVLAWIEDSIKKKIEEITKPPIPPLEEQVSKIEAEISTIYDRIKEIEAEAEKYTLEQVKTALKELTELRPRLRKLISDASELMEKIPEKEPLFEKAYDVWSFGKLAEDRLEKLIERLEELEEKLAVPVIPEEQFKGYLGIVETTLTLEALEEKAAEFPWDKLSEEQRRILSEAIEKRRREIALERRYRKIFDTIMEMIKLSETEEQLSEVAKRIEEVPIPESMKEVLRSELEKKRKEIAVPPPVKLPVVPPPPPVAPPPPVPVPFEVKKELDYLEAQRALGQKMHSQIERSLKRLEELGYPVEKIEEVKAWFA